MPWKSVQQARWGHSASGLKALGGKAAVSEWDSATKPGSLPARKGPMNTAPIQKEKIKKALPKRKGSMRNAV